jgi:ABC-type transport system involved in multi-copper enzyme maturation permease subunit
MTTAPTTTTSGTAVEVPAHGVVDRPDLRVSLPRVFVSELVKLRSLHSTVWTLLAAVLSIIGFGVVGAWAELLKSRTPQPPPLDPVGGALTGVSSAMIAVALLGLLAVTGEYGSGTIRTSLTTVPRRTTLLIGKALALVALTLTLMLPATVLAFAAAQLLLSANGLSISLAHPGVLRAVVGAALSIAVLAVLSAAVGWLLRRTAGAMAVLFALLVLLPLPLMLLPAAIARAVGPYLPGSVATAITHVGAESPLPPWAAFGVFVGYAVLASLAGAVTLQRRDA